MLNSLTHRCCQANPTLSLPQIDNKATESVCHVQVGFRLFLRSEKVMNLGMPPCFYKSTQYLGLYNHLRSEA